MFKKFAAAALVIALAAPAFAQGTATPGLDKREANMERRMEQGRASGTLTAKESNRLERRKAHLEQSEERAKADGQLTRKERARLNLKADRLSHDIAREKHDRQVAAPATVNQ